MATRYAEDQTQRVTCLRCHKVVEYVPGDIDDVTVPVVTNGRINRTESTVILTVKCPCGSSISVR